MEFDAEQYCSYTMTMLYRHKDGIVWRLRRCMMAGKQVVGVEERDLQR